MNNKIKQPKINSIYRILILTLLNSKPRSGYDLIICLEGILGNKPSHGKIYPFLNELLKLEYLSVKENECDIRSKVIYELTEVGNELLSETMGYLETVFSHFLNACCNCGTKFYSSRTLAKKEDEKYCCFYCKTAKMVQDSF